MDKHLASAWIAYINVNWVLPTGRIAGFSLQPTISSLAGVEYLWSENFSLAAHFDYYSLPLHGTGTQVFDNGVTEVAAGFSYRLRPHLLWQVYGVENLDFIVGSAADFTLSTLITYIGLRHRSANAGIHPEVLDMSGVVCETDRRSG